MSAMTAYPTGAHQILAELIAADDIRDCLRVVFDVTHNGERWMVATNGRALFAERSDDAPTEDFRGPDPDERKRTPTPDQVAAVTFPAGGETILGEVTAARLQEFAGEVPAIPPPVICTVCNGTGTLEHFCDCDYCDREEEECYECDGEKATQPATPQRFGWIGEGSFDRNVLARVTHLLNEPGPYALTIAPFFGASRIRISGQNHFAVVVGCRVDEEYEGQRDAPRFEVVA